MILPKSVQNLIESFSSLPGIGPKSASRLAFHVLHSNKEFAQEFADSIVRVKADVKECKECFNLTETEICLILCKREQKH